ncbi:MAG: rhomboid family intramembrane serine protease [Bacteroidales bacterium]|nr:MAG: rhomboid family intramembrane serine protease [Bacteroidales bacterium]
MSIATEIKDSFRLGSNLTKIIYINLAVFVIYNLVKAIFFLFLTPIDESSIQLLAVPAYIPALLSKPWTIFTYMFFHEGFLHILFNMLWLYWFGMIFLEYLSQKKLVGVYIMGGLSGAAIYILAFNVLGVFSEVLPISVALGASASVLAIVVAISTLKPNHTINLLFIGAVKLKYLALFSIILDIISIPTSNSGGHIAHIGGGLFGFLYIAVYRQGFDLAKPITWILSLFTFDRKPKSHLKVNYRNIDKDYEYNKRKVDQQVGLDKILDKIAKSGYDSLSKEEKETLFKFKDNSIN